MPELTAADGKPRLNRGAGRPSLVPSVSAVPARPGSVLDALRQTEGRSAAAGGPPGPRSRPKWWLVVPVMGAVGLVAWNIVIPTGLQAHGPAASPTKIHSPAAIATSQVSRPLSDTVVAEPAPIPPLAARIEAVPTPVEAPPNTPPRDENLMVSARPVTEPSRATRKDDLTRSRSDKQVIASQKSAKTTKDGRRPTQGNKDPEARTATAASGDPEVDIIAALMRRLDGEAHAVATRGKARNSMARSGNHSTGGPAATCVGGAQEQSLACKEQ